MSGYRKIQDNPDSGSLQSTDIFYIVRDPSGTPVDLKCSFSTLLSSTSSGLGLGTMALQDADDVAITDGEGNFTTLTIGGDNVATENYVDTEITNLNLGTISIQDANSVAITGGTIVTTLLYYRIGSTISTSSSLVATDTLKYIKADATSGAVTITLPAIAGVTAGWFVTIERANTNSNLVTIDGNAAETISGFASLILRNAGEGYTILFDGTEYKIISHYGYRTQTIKLTTGTSWSVPPDVTILSKVVVQGGGASAASTGSSGGSRGGGGAGGTVISVNYSVTPSATITYQIGQGGAQTAATGLNGQIGNAGTDSIWDGTLTAEGGNPSDITNGQGGPAGDAIGGNLLNLRGNPGGSVQDVLGGNTSANGGASSYYGNAGQSSSGVNGGDAGDEFGGGGGGANGVSKNGGKGGNGSIIIEYIGGI